MSAQAIQDVERDIELELEQFHKRVYAGKLPADVIDLYRKAVFLIPPAGLDQNPVTQKRIIASKVEELRVIEVAMVLTAISVVEPFKLFDTLEEALEKQIELMECRKAYQKLIREKHAETDRKKQKQIELLTAGTGRIPMQVIR